jgi:malate dehydrogenase
MSARKKVTIVGGGQTGGMMAYRLAEKNICDIVIKDVAEFGQHHGKALDIMQGASFAGFEGSITATDEWEPTAGSDVVIITAGAPRKPGMTREDLLKGNAEVVGEYAAKNAARLSPNAVIIVFANPMDVMCHVAMQASGFPRERMSASAPSWRWSWVSPSATSTPSSSAATPTPQWCRSPARPAPAASRSRP